MRRLCRWLLNTLTTTSVLLCVATAALWLSAARGRHFLARLSPANGRTWSVRDRGQDRRAQLSCVSAFPHARMTGAWAAGLDPRQEPPGYVPLALAPAPANQGGGRSWTAIGVAFTWRRSQPMTIDASPTPTILSYQTVTSHTLLVPYWILAGAFGLAPLAWLIARAVTRFRRAGPTQCKTCRYDLTGNVSGVCPECGAAVASQSPHKAGQ